MISLVIGDFEKTGVNMLEISTTFVFRDATGKFPEYPTEDEGGSAAIFTQKDPAQVSDLGEHSQL